MIQRIARSRMSGLIAVLIILMLPGEPLLAALQQQGEDYAKKVKEAENKYLLGEFDNSIKILDESLKAADFPPALKTSAYELLAQNWLAKSYLEQAQSAIKSYLEQAQGAIKKLLLLVGPSYVPPADNPTFASEVEKVRQGMGPELAAEAAKREEAAKQEAIAKQEEAAKKEEAVKKEEAAKREEQARKEALAKKEEQLRKEAQAKREAEAKEKGGAWYENTLVLVGGGVLVAGGVALLLLGKGNGGGGNGNGNGDHSLPPPPTLP